MRYWQHFMRFVCSMLRHRKKVDQLSAISDQVSR